jgi:hypothetical protein
MARQHGQRCLVIAMAMALVIGAAVHVLDRDVRPARAGGGQWVWLYDPDAGMLLQVFPDDETKEIALEVPAGYYLGSMTFSLESDRFATCLTPNPPGQPDVNPLLAIYDITGETYLVQKDLGPIEACSAYDAAFSLDGTQFAFGVINEWDMESEELPTWTLFVVDTTTGETVNQLDSTDPGVTGLGDLSGYLPVVARFDGDAIVFILYEWGMAGSTVNPEGLTWYPETGILERELYLNLPGVDFLPGPGEYVWVTQDDAFPPTEVEGPPADYNVIMYTDGLGAAYPVYTHGAWALWGVQFIDGGRKLAVTAWDIEANTARLFYVDRSGQAGDIPPGVGGVLIGTEDGYMFLRTAVTPQTYELVQHVFAEGADAPEETVIWTGTSESFWMIAGSAPLVGAMGLEPFPAMRP